MTAAQNANSPILDILPLLPLQRGMLFHAVHSAVASDDPYVLQVSGRIHGPLQPEQVEAAWQTLISRHPTLRCAFIYKGQSEPRQAILRSLPFSITRLDWQALESSQQAAQLAELKARELATPFNLNRPPLLRFSLIQVGAELWDFVLTHHHIIIDGWSQSLLVAELYALMDAQINARQAELPQLPAFQDIVRAMLAQSDPVRDEIFWKTEFAAWQGTGLSLPGKIANAENLAHASSARPSRELSKELTRNLLQAARLWRITPATLCQLAWALVMARHTGQQDIVYGVTVSGRSEHAASMQAIGMFVNTVPLRLRIAAHESLSALAQRLSEKLHRLTSRSHADLSQIQQWAGISSTAPLLQSLIAFENFPLAGQEAGVGRLGLSALSSSERTSMPLALVIVPGDAWHIAMQTDCTQIPLTTASRMLDDFVNTLETLLEHWHSPCGQILDLLASAETASTALPLATPVEQPNLVAAWRAVVQAHGSGIAVKAAQQTYSYQQMDQASDLLAARLFQAGLEAGDLVAICGAREIGSLVAMLAVLKLGAAYVPLDPRNPAQRISLILQDAKPALILLDQSSEAVLQSALALAELNPPLLWLDQPEPAATMKVNLPQLTIPANAIAYVIFTSGSTGRPKGVLVSHANVLHLFAGAKACFDFGPQDKWSLFHSFAFDFSVWEIWGPWLSGGTSVLVPLEVAREPASLVRLVQEEGISVLSQTPSAFSVFAAAESALANKLDCLRWIVFGGEALTLAGLSGWIARHGSEAPKLINMYGITETTVHVTWRRIVAADLLAGRGSVIGQALPHLQMQLMDVDGRPVPTGSVGEIWVGGQGVSAGYLNLPRLTAERFVPDAAASRPGMRAYRSGDLARRHADGETDYLGRIDHQVKIRGFRIELGEIEQVLLQHASVAAAHAGVWQKEPQGDTTLLGLCAWVVLKAEPHLQRSEQQREQQQLDALRSHLAEKLPSYMQPDCILPVAQIALTINGKADRSRLPAPDFSAATAGNAGAEAANFAQPVSAQEKILCEAMAQALGRTALGIDDNYFSLGGDSIRSLRFASLAEQKGLAFPLRKLFELPTVRGLANWLAQEAEAATTPENANATANAAAQPALPANPPEEGAFLGLSAADRARLPADAVDAYPLSRLQAGMLYQAEVNAASALYLDLFSHHLSLCLQEEPFRRAVAALVASHAALRTSFQMDASTPLQVVHQSASLQVDWHDLRGLSAQQVQARIAADNQALRCQPYPLAQPGLLRIAVHRLVDDTCWLSMGCHHAILDGWSVALLSAQLLEFYAEASKGVILPQQDQHSRPLADFVRQEQALLQSPKARQYWQNQLDQLPASQLPRWGQIVPGQRPVIELQLAKETGAALQALCVASAIPVKSWLLAAAAHALAWNTGSQAFTLGLVVNGRAQNRASENALGLFLNTIPLALPASGSWRTLAQRAFQREADGHEWRSFPLAELLRMHGGKQPFEVNLNFVHFRPLAGLQEKYAMQALDSVSLESTDIPLTINFSIDPEQGHLAAKLVADDSFSSAQVQQVADALAEAIRQLLAQPDAVASCATRAAQEWAVQRFNPALAASVSAASTSASASMLPAQVLRRCMAQAPESTVLIDSEGQQIAAAQFLARILSIATQLQAAGGVSQRAVALYQSRSVDLIASQIAVTALGGYYVVLDLQTSSTRLLDILQDVAQIQGAPLLLSSSALRSHTAALAGACRVLEISPVGTQEAPHAGTNEGTNTLSPAELLASAEALLPTSAAYAIYTSGSTGKPKGVLIPHAALENHMAWMLQRFQFQAGDRVLQRTRLSFDASVWEVWAALAAGASLVLAPDAATADPAALLETVAQQHVNILQVVPSLLEALVTEPGRDALDGLRLLFVGGEALRKNLALEATSGRQLQLVNLYGPSETTIDASFEVLDVAHSHRSKQAYIPIGLPISATTAVVINEDFVALPCGAVGELLIGGLAVGQAYLGSPALTAERFVPDPFASASQPGARAFRSRDLVRRLADGRLEYIGRLDRQVKIGGNRIELEEIEAVLSALVAPRRCAVAAAVSNAAEANSALRLIAFVEQADASTKTAQSAHSNGPHTSTELRAALGQRLPAYMLPAVCHFVANWPFQPSGKTDYKALLRYSAAQLAASTVSAQVQAESASATASASVLANLTAKAAAQSAIGILQSEVSALLGLGEVPADADFFSIGGDSIAAMQLISRLRRRGLQLSARDVFTQRSIEKMAQIILPPSQPQAPSAAPPQPQTWPLLPIQEWFFSLNLHNPHYYHQTVALQLKRNYSYASVRAALQQLGQRHAALGARFDLAQKIVRQGDGQARLLHLRHQQHELQESQELYGVAQLPAERIYQAVDALQKSIHIQDGPLWGAVLVCRAEDQHAEAGHSEAEQHLQEHVSALVVVAHHLLIDGVSWRILLDELSILLDGGSLGAAETSLPSAALALQAWQPAAAETAFCQQLLARLPQAKVASVDLAGKASVLESLSLSAEQTSQLLTRTGPACKASMEELLLAAMLHAWSVISSAHSASLAPQLFLLEGHGREALPSLDLARTVGWFTSHRPLLLESGVASPIAALQLAKSQLRALAGNGAAWLKLLMQSHSHSHSHHHHHHHSGLHPAQAIIFNYLGRFDGTVGGADTPFEALHIDLPAASDPANQRSSLLDVVGLIEQQSLRLTLDGDEARLGTGFTRRMLALMDEALQALCQLEGAPARSVWLRSDFPLAALESDAQLQQLLTELPASEIELLPCTPLQQGMVFSHAQQAGSSSGSSGSNSGSYSGSNYTQQLEISLAAAPDVSRLRAAFAQLCARHPALRTCFVETDSGKVLQAVQAQISLPLLEKDFCAEADALASWQAYQQADAARGFDLRHAPLLRLTLAQLSQSSWRLLWTHHHLISDGWSQPILLQELLQLYLDPQQPLPAATPIAKQYWESLLASAETTAPARQAWQQQFADFQEPSLIAGSAANVASAANSTRNQSAAVPAQHNCKLPAQDSQALQQFCRQHGLTMASVMLGAWGCMLGKILHSKDVAFGMVVSGRPPEISGSEHWVGMFINTLPVRVQLATGTDLIQWLGQQNLQLAQLNDSAHLALPQIQSWVNQGRALFDTIVVIENYPLQAVAQQQNPLAVTEVNAHEVNEYPLSLYVEGGDTLSLRYDAARLELPLVEAIADGVMALLKAWSTGASKLGESAAIAPAAYQQLATWGQGVQLVDDGQWVIDKILAQAARRADALALVDANGQQLHYAQLLQQASQLALGLQARGVQAGDWVAVMGEHRAPLLVGLLAVQLCHAVFIPLDASFPAARLQMILEDCQPKLVLHDAANRSHPVLPGYACATLEEVLAESAQSAVASGAVSALLAQGQPKDAQALAYILFTSGSSGRPKGVQISQRAFANALRSFSQTPGLSEQDVFAAATTISFDISLLELFLPLTVGAQVLMIDKQVARDGVRLAATLAAHKVSAFQGTPSTWKLLCAAACRLPISAWCGGEALSRALRDEMVQRFAAVWNLYGPTETTIWSSVARQSAQPGQQAVLAGKPIANTSLFLLDADGQLAPPGAIGEICIGGAGVMQGYLGQTQLTAAALLADALLAAPAQAYRTGDLGRWSADGELEVLGRADRQLKLAGYRIELGDIEAALRSIQGVADAAVVLQKIGQQAALVGYLVLQAGATLDASSSALEVARIRQALTSLLPQYMQPSHLLALRSLPLTLNGKLDQRALPLPNAAEVGAETSVEAARETAAVSRRQAQGAVEQALLQVWCSAFENQNIGVEDDFFALGGHSFVATQIHARLVRIFRSEVPLASIFEATTVARLAQAIIASESAPGMAQKQASAWLRVQAMSPAERAALRAKIKS